jgi:hypothetical protein
MIAMIRRYLETRITESPCKKIDFFSIAETVYVSVFVLGEL